MNGGRFTIEQEDKFFRNEDFKAGVRAETQRRGDEVPPHLRAAAARAWVLFREGEGRAAGDIAAQLVQEFDYSLERAR